MGRRSSGLTALGMVLALAAGCASGSSPTPSPTAAPTVAPTAPSSGGTSAAPASFDPSKLPPAETTTIKFAEGGIDPGTFQVRLAMDAGLLQKYGLTGQESTFNGATQVIQALIAKQLNVAISTSSQTILTLGTSDPAVDVVSMSTKMPDYLYAAKGITGAADLKGKKAAVSTLGSQAYQEVIVGMQQLGLQPSDMVITPIGGQSARVAALESGTVAIAAADPALESKLAKDGINPIVKLPELASVEFAGVNVMLLSSFVKANPGTTLRLVAAVLEANHMYTSDEASVVGYYQKWAQIDQPTAKDGIDVYIKNGLNPTLYASQKAYQTAQSVLVPLNPSVSGFDITKAYDFSFLDTLKKDGLFAQLGIPTN